MAAVRPAKLWIEPRDGLRGLIQLINHANRQIFVEDYILTDRRIVRALERAQTQGVRVFAMLEPHPYGMGNQPQRIADELRASGIQFRWSSPQFALTHAKFIVIDDRIALISTANFSRTGFSTNREFLILDTDRVDVRTASSLFRSDWDRLPFRNADRHLVVSPIDSREVLTGLIRSAHRQLDVYSEELQDPGMARQFIGAERRGVRVRVLLPFTPPLANMVRNGGVKLGLLAHPYIHAKVIIVDNSRAFVGSENLSTQSLDRNREAGILVRGPAVTAMTKVFESDWRLAMTK